MNYRIAKWDEYQHYRDRTPPWIKLHFALLSSKTWVLLDDAGRVLAVACMLLASRNGGEIDGDSEYVRQVAYLHSAPDFDALVRVGFLVPLADASTLQADASGCYPREEKRREETEQSRAERACARGGGGDDDGFDPLAPDESWSTADYIRAFKTLPNVGHPTDSALAAVFSAEKAPPIRVQAWREFACAVHGATQPIRSSTAMLAGYLRNARRRAGQDAGGTDDVIAEARRYLQEAER